MSEAWRQKLIDLESSLGLLQHDFEAQNEMLLRDQRRIALLEQAVARLASQMEAVRAATAVPRTLEDDKPPHY